MNGLTLSLVLALAGGAPGDKDDCKSCGNENFGTSVAWAGTPSEAAEKATKEKKLVFILHVSGHFEDPRFT